MLTIILAILAYAAFRVTQTLCAPIRREPLAGVDIKHGLRIYGRAYDSLIAAHRCGCEYPYSRIPA